MKLSVLPWGLLPVHMILAVSILATVFLATHIVLKRRRQRRLTRRIQRMFW